YVCACGNSPAIPDSGSAGDLAMIVPVDGAPPADGFIPADGSAPADLAAPADTAISTSDGAALAPGRFFPAGAPWYTDVSNAPLDGESAAVIAGLQAAGGWGNGNKFQIDF